MPISLPDLRITAKRLGMILLTNYCCACLWFLLRLRFDPPFNQFGGAIWNDMEAMQKALVGHYLETTGCLPDKFGSFTDIVSRLDYNGHWSKYGYMHDSDVWLYGAPDEIFKLSDGNLCVVDHKTAHDRGAEDEFLPEYQIQVIGYGNIAEVGLELGRVTKGGIFYWDVQRKSVIEKPQKYVRDGCLCPPFAVSPVEVEMDFSRLDPLFKELKKVWKSKTPPATGLENCKGCKRRNALLAIADSLLAEDQRAYDRAPYLQQDAARRYFTTKNAWYSAISSIQREPEGSGATDMMTAWYQ